MITCPKCNYDNTSEVEYCARCGQGLTSEAVSAEVARDVHSSSAAFSPSLPASNPHIEPILSHVPVVTDCTPVPSHPNITVSVRNANPPTPSGRPVCDKTPMPTWPTALPAVQEAKSSPVEPATVRNRPGMNDSGRTDATKPAKTDTKPAPPASSDHPASVTQHVRLVVLRGLKIGVEYPIYEGRNTIGRFIDKPVDIDLIAQESIEQTWCSRMHAAMTMTNGTITVEDLNSLNGTWVNGMRINPGQPRTLKSGDILQIGTVQMKLFVD